MRTVSFFVASSNEISDIRRNLVIRVAEKNKVLSSIGAQIEIDEWEFESTAIPASGRSQDDYNKLLAHADLAAVLIKNKVGKYTQEEFVIALTLFRTHGKPKICVYALPADKPEPSLAAFLEELRGGKYGLDYFPAPVKDENELWIRLNSELDRLINAQPAPQPVPLVGGTVIGRQINLNGGGTYNEFNH